MRCMYIKIKVFAEGSEVSPKSLKIHTNEIKAYAKTRFDPNVYFTSSCKHA
jgi:hypothetical protein